MEKQSVTGVFDADERHKRFRDSVENRLVMDLAVNFWEFLLGSFLLLAPMLLLGLLLSGLLHVFIPKKAIQHWFKHDNLKSITTSAAIGVPIPLCSCSVVPIVAEMHRKGASRSSCMSFLITAPETGADSILITNAFFGPVVAIVRPIVSFVTAVITGFCNIKLDKGQRHSLDDKEVNLPKAEGRTLKHIAFNKNHSSVHRSHSAHTSPTHSTADFYVSPLQFWQALRKPWMPSDHLVKQSSQASSDFPTNAYTTPNLKEILKRILHYGFIEIADDILFALLVGLLLGGVLFLFLPNDLVSSDYTRWLSYPVMVAVGIPLYICASASTPIAAALVAKGVSPGAALVFLMTGPATNTGTIAVIVGQFGKRFASIYVGGVIGVTVVLGLLIDLILVTMGVSIVVNLGQSVSPTLLFVQWSGAITLLGLMTWRFHKGAFRRGFTELVYSIIPSKTAHQKS